jgi:hypothetical protein
MMMGPFACAALDLPDLEDEEVISESVFKRATLRRGDADPVAVSAAVERRNPRPGDVVGSVKNAETSIAVVVVKD